MTDNSELKRAASAAKNWGGEVGEGRWYAAECFKRPYFSVPDAEFIAACDPGQVLALIAENERNQRMVLSACMSMGAIGESLGLDMDSDGDEMLGMVAELKAERDQLRAEIAGLRTGYEAYERVNAELKAEVEGLRKDADSRIEWAKEASAEIDRLQGIEAECGTLRDDLEQNQYDANAWRNGEESVWIEVFNIEGDDPFICAISGQITVEQLDRKSVV